MILAAPIMAALPEAVASSIIVAPTSNALASSPRVEIPNRQAMERGKAQRRVSRLLAEFDGAEVDRLELFGGKPAVGLSETPERDRELKLTAGALASGRHPLEDLQRGA